MSHQCPTKVGWRKIDLKPLWRVMNRVVFHPDDSTKIPEHLYCNDEEIRQYWVEMEFSSETEYKTIERALYASGLSWNSFDHTVGYVDGGSVFRRKDGYYILEGPCIHCYGELPKIHGDNTDELEKCVIRYSI